MRLSAIIPKARITTHGIAPCLRLFSDSCCFDAFLILVAPMHLTAYLASPAAHVEGGDVLIVAEKNLDTAGLAAAQRYLFLKQIVEGFPRICSGSRCGLRRNVGTRSIHAVAAGQPVAGHSHSWREQTALIPRVLHRDTFRDGLQTLEARGWLKMRALLTAMQRRAALRAVSSKVRVSRQGHRATVTARSDHTLNEARELWACDVEGWSWALLLGAVGPIRVISFGLLVPPLFISAISVHRR
jgi:hypothetical protein